MRDVEGLAKYEQVGGVGGRHSKPPVSRVDIELDDFNENYVPFHSHVSSTSHMSAIFDYEVIFRLGKLRVFLYLYILH